MTYPIGQLTDEYTYSGQQAYRIQQAGFNVFGEPYTIPSNTSDTGLSGIWAMFDWVDDPGRGGAWQGFGHYHEQYVKGPDGQWRIREVHLTRLRIDKVEPREPIQHVSIDDSQLERSRHPADTLPREWRERTQGDQPWSV